MTVITDAELNLLRTRPHTSNLWLSIYKPMIVLQCQVNDASAAPGMQVIAYDNVTVDNRFDVWGWATMYVGTTPGGKDVGKIRTRHITDSNITVGNNSDINWEDDLYLTIVSFLEINTVFPRIDIPNPSDPTQQVWYKDYDIAYTNQNSSLGSFICMGSHYAGFIDPDSGTCDVYYTSTGTYNLKGESLTYQWFFQGATVTGSVAADPGYISYDTPGHYITRLQTDAESPDSVDLSYRYISIYDRPDQGTNVPILNWELLSLDGSRDMGGYQARIKIRENIEDVVEGALIILFSDDWYGDTKQSIGGNATGREHIFFVGYILDGSISYDYSDSSVDFTVGSPSEVMKITEGYGVALNSSSDPEAQDAVDDDIPSTWALMLNMDCKRAIYHYLKWHSTTLFVCDFEFRGTDKYIEFFDADRESVYDAINNFMLGTLYGNLVSDRQGKLWAETSVATMDSADIASSISDVMNINKQDWIGAPTIEQTPNQQVGYVEFGGASWTDITGSYEGTYGVYLCCAPGSWPSYRGSVRNIQGLAVDDQDDLNALAGNVWAYMNSKYAHVSLDLSGNYRNIDIAPQEIIELNLAQTDTPMGIVWEDKNFHPTEMSWVYNPQRGALLPRLILHEITEGFPASTITIPAVPPVTDPGGVGYNVPPIVIPPITFTGWLYVYHNGVLVAVVSGLNFVDSA